MTTIIPKAPSTFSSAASTALPATSINMHPILTAARRERIFMRFSSETANLWGLTASAQRPAEPDRWTGLLGGRRAASRNGFYVSGFVMKMRLVPSGRHGTVPRTR